SRSSTCAIPTRCRTPPTATSYSAWAASSPDSRSRSAPMVSTCRCPTGCPIAASRSSPATSTAARARRRTCRSATRWWCTGGASTFFAVDTSCTGTGCDTAYVDGGFLAEVPAPEPGTILSFLRGIFDQRQGRRQILLRGADDVAIGSPPAAIDAFPIFDNDA